MAVETTTRKVTFTEDGSTVDFDFTFRALTAAPTDIKCKRRVIATGVESDLTYTTDYTAAINSDGIGGTVTVVSAASTAIQLVIYRETTKTQESDYNDYNQFPADTLETDLDRAIMAVQELSEDVDRSLKIPISSTISSITIPDGEADKVLGWSPSGSSIVNMSGHTESITLCSSYATITGADATTSSSEATTATAQAAISTSEATTSTSEATTATAQGAIATSEATTSSSHATTATGQAVISASEATTATTQATLASSHATTSLTGASTATSSATVSTSESVTAVASAVTSTSSATVSTSEATTAITYSAVSTSSATVSTSEATTAINARNGTITFIIDGGGDAITTGIKGDLRIPFACTLAKSTLMADQSTTSVIDIWKDTFANFPPTNSDSVTASAAPSLSAIAISEDSTLSGWTTAIAADDILRFNVNSNDNATRITMSLGYTRS